MSGERSERLGVRLAPDRSPRQCVLHTPIRDARMSDEHHHPVDMKTTTTDENHSLHHTASPPPKRHRRSCFARPMLLVRRPGHLWTRRRVWWYRQRDGTNEDRVGQSWSPRLASTGNYWAVHVYRGDGDGVWQVARCAAAPIASFINDNTFADGNLMVHERDDGMVQRIWIQVYRSISAR